MIVSWHLLVRHWGSTWSQEIVQPLAKFRILHCSQPNCPKHSSKNLECSFPIIWWSFDVFLLTFFPKQQHVLRIYRKIPFVQALFVFLCHSPAACWIQIFPEIPIVAQVWNLSPILVPKLIKTTFPLEIHMPNLLWSWRWDIVDIHQLGISIITLYRKVLRGVVYQPHT